MLICVTNRKLCTDDFINRINLIAKGKPHAIMLREKDLDLDDYENLAVRINQICDQNQVPLIINQNIQIAEKIKLNNIHLSMIALRKHRNEIRQFIHIGASVHSVEEAMEAQELGATAIVAGHIFSTDCKKGVEPRGLSFLKEVCDSVTIPVFAIGGITSSRVCTVLSTGAKGFCVMSEAMTCPDPLHLPNTYQMSK